MTTTTRGSVFPFLVDEKPLCEPPPEIVATDVPKVVAAGLVRRPFCSALDDRPDASRRAVDKRLVSAETLGVPVSAQLSLAVTAPLDAFRFGPWISDAREPT